MANYYIIVISTCVIKNYKYTEQQHCLLMMTMTTHTVPRSVSVWQVCGPHPSYLRWPLPRVPLPVVILVLPCVTPIERVSRPANSALHVP